MSGDGKYQGRTILGVPFGGSAGQALVAGAGGVPAWSDTFGAAKTIDLGSGPLPAALSSTRLTLTGPDGEQNRLVGVAFSATPINLSARVAGGTRAAPADVPNGQPFYSLAPFGYRNGAWDGVNAGTFTVFADGAWSATNKGILYAWAGTYGGTTTTGEWMRLQNGILCLGTTPTTGNGLLQLPAGTTKANGIALGPDLFLHRDGATQLAVTDGATKKAQLHMQFLELGIANGSTADQTVYIDFHASEGTPAQTDYSARILRGTGADGSLVFDNKGNGEIQLWNGGTSRFRLDASGNFNLRGGTPSTPSAFAAWTGTATRSSIATGSATVANCAEAIKALIDDLKSIGVLP